MDIILEFCVRNHSGIDLHDTDIDFFRPIVFKKKNSPFDLLCVNETVLFYYLCSIEARDLLDLVKVLPEKIRRGAAPCMAVAVDNAASIRRFRRIFRIVKFPECIRTVA